MIGRHVPDVIAVKGGHTTIVEVETEDSVGTARDVEQRAAFEMWASQDPRARRFEWMVV
jgi:Holliday junction resolvase